ncbi:glycosyltransferase family 2 protein [Acidisoma sp.]|uniref:glycosyltransferase family 2 protein n=1 Tax=Acidisoma sp. TaxID=1872115 RepID=UPI003B00C795
MRAHGSTTLSVYTLITDWNEATFLLKIGKMTARTAHRGGDVIIVIPAHNEQEYIRDVIYSLQSDLDCSEALIVVADDGSTDATQSIVEQIGRLDRRVVAFGSHSRLGVSASINRAVKQFGAGYRWLVRVDAHAEYPPNYASRLVQVAVAQGATAVVTAMTSRGSTCFQRAAAASQNSYLGTGGSAHRMVGGAGSWVEHGHHALVALDSFVAAGGYDETFSHNEDAELDHRILDAGGRIWLEPDLSIVYFPRKTARLLARQYYKYGFGRAMTVARHGGRRRLRQILPLGIAPVWFLLLLSPLFPLAALPFLGWAAICVCFGLALSVRGGVCAALSGPAAMIMQTAWSLGYWTSILGRRKPGPPPTELTLRPLPRVEQPLVPHGHEASGSGPDTWRPL